MILKPSGLTSVEFVSRLRAKVERNKASDQELARILGIDVEDIEGDNDGE